MYKMRRMSQIADNTYELLDSGVGRKLERFGKYVLSRPCSQALWRPRLPEADWQAAHASFDREEGNRWSNRSGIPDAWTVDVDGTLFKLSGTDFGHLGIFPEQRANWARIRAAVETAAARLGRRPSLLNLFAYSGGSTLAAARAGAEVCHLDASAGMVDWARENARINGLAGSPIRWIVEDAHKYLGREARRGRRYDAIILDPPSFGRGARGEVYKLERDLPHTLEFCRALLSDTPILVLLSAHTPGVTPVVLANLLADMMRRPAGRIDSGEMLLSGADAVPVPSGCWAGWAWT